MESEKKSNGALIGSVIIIIILIIGGIYIWQSKMKSTLEEKAKVQNIIQMNANELDALEQNLNTTDTNIGVDANTIN